MEPRNNPPDEVLCVVCANETPTEMWDGAPVCKKCADELDTLGG